MYILKFTDEGLRDVRALPKNVLNALKRELKEKLAKDPNGCTSGLKGALANWRSFSWGDYRVVLKVYEDLRAIAIAGIGERSHKSEQNIYRRLESLAVSGKLAERVLLALRGFTAPTSKATENAKLGSNSFHPSLPHRIRRRKGHKAI